MRVLVNGKLYDSTKTPILIEFHENEKSIFGVKRYVSAPKDSTVEDRQKLIDTPLDDFK